MFTNVSLYTCRRDGNLPIFIESARLRMSTDAGPISVGDEVAIGDRSFVVKQCQSFPHACRIIADVERMDLDPSLVQDFELLQLEMQYGQTASESMVPVGTIRGAIADDSRNHTSIHDSRQSIHRCRIFLSKEDAGTLNSLSILRGDQDYKVSGVYDLNVPGRVPYAICEVRNLKLVP